MDDLLEEFIAETRETLEVLSGQLIEWEYKPEDRELVDGVFRFVHTVKGSCGFLDLPRLEKLSHAAEDLLSSARNGDLVVQTDMVSAVLAVVDRISALTDALESGENIVDNDQDLIDHMMLFLPVRHTQDTIGSFIQGVTSVDSATSETENDFVVNDDEDINQPADVDDIPKETWQEQIEENVVLPSVQKRVNVPLQLLDELMNSVSDMVLARNEVSRKLRLIKTNGELDQSFTRLSSTVADLRDSVSLMRMQNIDRLFSSLPRLVRDTMLELGKDVRLEIEGSEVELDREMIEALRDPLSHIIRNSVDHGIELPEEREAAGKNPIGNIKVAARQSGNQIILEITDDGRGIDISKLERKALNARLVSHAELSNMSDKVKLNLIFKAGLSTAEKVTSISGRGVGMDVVRNNLQTIGGTIELENLSGNGLKMTLRLPLTLSIIAGLSIRAGNQIFGISRNSVEEILSFSNNNVEIEEFGGAMVASIRGKRMPYARLEDVLGLEMQQNKHETRTLVVVKPGIGQKFVLDVQNVLDHEELVVKPGAPIIMQNGIYAGTSLPDNGRPMLLLDANGIANDLGLEDAGNKSIYSDAQEKVQDTAQTGDSALLFKNLDGRKQALRLTVIERMEEVEGKYFEHIGGNIRVNVDNMLLDVVGIDEMPDKDSHVQILRLTDGDNHVCMVIAEVLDMFKIQGHMIPSRQPDLHEGIVEAHDENVELLSIFSFFADSFVANVQSQDKKALCLLSNSEHDGWEKKILAPLLVASGYDVSFEDEDNDKASVILTRGSDTFFDDVNDNRIVRLRDSSFASKESAGSIYKYDRTGLIAAIESKVAEG